MYGLAINLISLQFIERKSTLIRCEIEGKYMKSCVHRTFLHIVNTDNI